MKALVTGAAGFIGSHLTDRLLQEGWEVTALDSFSPYYARSLKLANVQAARTHPACRFIEADLNDIELAPVLEGVDYVFHLAGQPGVQSWGAAFAGYLDGNLLATQRLLETAKGRELRAFLYASSSSIYGEAEAYPTPESTQPLPISPYGVTKLGGEHLCWLYWRSFGVPAVRLRFFTVYGPRQRPDMAFHIFSRAILTGRPLHIFGDGNQSREFTYVSDIVDGLLAAAKRGPAGSIFNLGGGSETSLNDAIATLMDVSGSIVPLVHDEAKAGDARRTRADITLAREALGYEPRIALEEGLRRQVEWMRCLLSEEASLAGQTVARAGQPR